VSTDSFTSCLTVLTHFLDKRQPIVEAIESRLLNVRACEAGREGGRAYFEKRLDECFFSQPSLPAGTASVRGLSGAHLADGFEPVLLDRFSRELSPVELVGRAYLHWNQRRWPGRSGRITYAHIVYAAFVLRHLEYLSLRIWDDGHPAPEERLSAIQRLLDGLNANTSTPNFVRDAAWLIQTAQGALTKHLDPYFAVAGRIRSSFGSERRLQIHAAGAKLAGGHLRSQLRYRLWASGQAIGHPDNLAVTRNSNSMDAALLVWDLVPLLRAYEKARTSSSHQERSQLADAILQGLSADPELLLSRLDLLRPCTMIESLFISHDRDGRDGYTPLGQAHLQLLDEYTGLVGEAAAGLRADAVAFDPALRVYSPYGIVYGFIADVMSDIALVPLSSHATSGAGIEEILDSFADPESNLARAKAWERLPRLVAEREHFEHSMEWACQIFDRLTRALDHRAEAPTALNASPVADAKLYVQTAFDPRVGVTGPADAVVADEHCFTSDLGRAASSSITAWPRSQMLSDRNEGRFLASVERDGKWYAVSKVILTVCTSHGRNAVIHGVPAGVVEVLRLTCPGLVEQA
jgi:hypothetical protein